MREVYTTWNKVARALQECEGFYEGFGEKKEDIAVRLVQLENFPDYYEVEVEYGQKSFGTCYFDADGDPTSLRDWVPGGPNREGIAVPREVLDYLGEKEGGFNNEN